MLLKHFWDRFRSSKNALFFMRKKRAVAKVALDFITQYFTRLGGIKKLLTNKLRHALLFAFHMKERGAEEQAAKRVLMPFFKE